MLEKVVAAVSEIRNGLGITALECHLHRGQSRSRLADKEMFWVCDKPPIGCLCLTSTLAVGGERLGFVCSIVAQKNRC